MPSLFSSLFCCCGASSDTDEVTERTTLISHGIIPEAPLGRTTEQELAEQDALRQILSTASDRFINVESDAPFARTSPFSSRSTSPASPHRPPNPANGHSTPPEDRGSLWRPSDTPVTVIHLGTTFDQHPSPATPGKRNGGGALQPRPTSSLSLKAIRRPSATGIAKRSPLRPTSDENEEGDTREQDHDGSPGRRTTTSALGTVGTYKTAREGESSEDGTGEVDEAHRVRKGKKKADARGALKDIWKADEEASSASEEAFQETTTEEEGVDENEGETTNELSIALKALEDSMQTFTLKPVGPLVEDLTEQM